MNQRVLWSEMMGAISKSNFFIEKNFNVVEKSFRFCFPKKFGFIIVAGDFNWEMPPD